MSLSTKLFVWKLLSPNPAVRLDAYRNRMHYIGHLYSGELRPEDYAAIEYEILWFVQRRHAPLHSDILEERHTEHEFLGDA